MPLHLNFLEKLVFKNFNLAPGPMLDVMGGFSFHVISSAIQLNIFETLKDEPLPLDKLASKLNTDPRGLIILLECLESLGYVKKKKNCYHITAMTKKWALDSSEASFKLAFEYYLPTMIEIWPYIAESVRIGEPYINFYSWLKDKPEVAATYQKFMMSLAVLNMPEILNALSFKNEKVLDIGGSHGLYSIALCRKNKDIDITIIDSEYSMPVLNKNIREAGLTERINTITADFTTHTLDKKYDAILLFNVLHEHKEEDNLPIIEKIYNSLNPGGRIIILDGMNEKKLSPVLSFGLRIYSLVFFHFLGGQNYSFSEISGWLKGYGFKKIKRKNLIKSGFSIIEGWR
jgi:2-polyprenyl-3-methyl-5-hydroxy-6-metoxy-1,4-benzoquinol methylase